MRAIEAAVTAVLLCSGCGPAEFATISNTPAGAYEVSLATFDDGIVAAWYDTRDGHGEIYVRSVDGAGAPQGPSAASRTPMATPTSQTFNLSGPMWPSAGTTRAPMVT